MFYRHVKIYFVGVALLISVVVLSGCELGWGGSSPFSSKLSIGNINASNITTNSVTITWTTDIKATSQVEYGTDRDYGTKTTEDVELVTSHRVVINSGLGENTEYHYRVISKDEEGNEAVSDDQTFNKELTISAVSASGITGAGAVISWSTNFPSSRQVNYGLDTGYGSSTPVDTTMSTQHQVVLGNLSQATVYHYQVVSLDQNGNDATSGDNAFTTLTTSSDLFISSLIVSNTQPFVFEPILILAVLENEGDAAQSDVEIRFFDNDVKLGSDVTSDQIQPGSSSLRLYNLSFLSEGDHLIKIVIDPENKVVETDENNNIRYLSLAVVNLL